MIKSHAICTVHYIESFSISIWQILCSSQIEGRAFVTSLYKIPTCCNDTFRHFTFIHKFQQMNIKHVIEIHRFAVECSSEHVLVLNPLQATSGSGLSIIGFKPLDCTLTLMRIRCEILQCALASNVKRFLVHLQQHFL